MPLQNVVQYCGSRADREVIRAHEFHYTGDRGKRPPLKFDVLLVRVFSQRPPNELSLGWMLKGHCDLPPHDLEGAAVDTALLSIALSMT